MVGIAAGTWAASVLCWPLGAQDATPPAPSVAVTAVKTDTPRDTMATFMDAMDDYVRGVREEDLALQARIDNAIRTLNLEHVSAVTRDEVGRKAAILLKEVIDRSVVIEESRIPDTAEEARWRLKDTEISVSKVEGGERSGEYLFSPDTVQRAELLYERVRNRPYLAGTTRGAEYREPWMRNLLPQWGQIAIAGIALWQWLGLFAVILLGLTMRAIVSGLGRIVLKLTEKTDNDWDNRIVRSLRGPLALLASCGLWYGTLHLLNFTGPALVILTVAIRSLFFAAVIWTSYRLAGVMGDFLAAMSARSATPLDDHLLRLISRTLKVFVVVFGALVAAQNLGVQVFSLLAGLGLGGLALALAAQDTLSNLFASTHIMIDRPFRVGHWIKSGDDEGVVEDIGFRSTRVRTFYNSLISIPNSRLANQNIDNMGLRRYRRVKTTVGVTYDTPPDKLERFVEGMRKAIEGHPTVVNSPIYVVFNDFGPSSLDIMVYFFLRAPDWNTELTERQAVLFKIVRLAHELGVEFAFPTQTLHIASMPPQDGLPAA